MNKTLAAIIALAALPVVGCAELVDGLMRVVTDKHVRD